MDECRIHIVYIANNKNCAVTRISREKYVLRIKRLQQSMNNVWTLTISDGTVWNITYYDTECLLYSCNIAFTWYSKVLQGIIPCLTPVQCRE